MPETFLSLGSNLGNRKQYIVRAEKLIEHEIGAIREKSSLYETEPWGFHHPANFYNKVLLVSTDLIIEQVWHRCLSIEKQLGRQREKNKYEARTIDIDILFYNDLILHTDTLQIPHPLLHLRKFVLEPLNEIMPDRIHPVIQKEIRQILHECIDRSFVRKL
jgi:2-amino-4-hydroxy-6-hydroxymethyldihydropteridine diphosphokinase